MGSTYIPKKPPTRQLQTNKPPRSEPTQTQREEIFLQKGPVKSALVKKKQQQQQQKKKQRSRRCKPKREREREKSVVH